MFQAYEKVQTEMKSFTQENLESRTSYQRIRKPQNFLSILDESGDIWQIF